MHRVQGNAVRLEPVGDFTDVLFAIGVVEVLPGGEDFDRLRSGFYELIEQARMEPFLHINVC